LDKNLVPKLRMIAVNTPPPYAFMVWTGTTLHVENWKILTLSGWCIGVLLKLFCFFENVRINSEINKLIVKN